MRALALLLIGSMLSGCVKEIRTAGGTHIKFATGFDFGAHASATDTLDSRRQIKPE